MARDLSHWKCWSKVQLGIYVIEKGQNKVQLGFILLKKLKKGAAEHFLKMLK